MNDNLRATLDQLIQSDSRFNPAVNALINDYITYHVVLVVAGGLAALVLMLLSFYFWNQWTRAPKTDKHKWTFEKKTYFFFGAFSTAIGVLMGLLVAINASTVLDSRQGFSLIVRSLETPKIGTRKAERYQAFKTWIQSDSNNMPSLIQSKILKRVAFHTTKAIVCSLLLVVFVALSTRLWGTLIKQSRELQRQWRLKQTAILICGTATVSLCLLMLVIVLANTQAAFAPVTLILLYG
jgi:hypothetical protein